MTVCTSIGIAGCSAPRVAGNGEFVQYGGMHEAIGQGKDFARVSLADVAERPHFYGIGAMEGLAGEITIADSRAVATRVGTDGEPHSLVPLQCRATLLVGQSIEDWTSVTLEDPVRPENFDETIAAAARRHGADDTGPFMFTISGEFQDVRLHILNGACPMHARMNKFELDASSRPYELEVPAIEGTLVGVFARDAVGKLTHPATSTHNHLIFLQPESGDRVNGHLERVGIASGAVLRLPSTDTAGVATALR